MSAEMQPRLAALAQELAAAVGALVGAAAAVGPGEPAGGRSWVATLTAGGAQPGRCVVTVDHAGAAALSGLVAAPTDAAEEATVSALLRAVIAEAVTAMAGRSAEERLDLTLAGLEPHAGDPQVEGATPFVITADGLTPSMPVTLGWTPSAEAAVAAVLAPDVLPGSRLDVLLGIDLPVVVRFGHTKMPIRALSRIGPGSIIDLGRSPDDPVDVLVSNHVVARGEVVIVGGNYGVRILDVTSQAERARSMEA